MIQQIRKPKYLTPKDEIEFLNQCKNVKYKLNALLQLDSGLRISETCALRVKDINFQKGEMYILSLKKGKDKSGNKREVWRTVYLTDRTIQCAAEYFKQSKISEPHAYIFPSPSIDGDSIDRQQFWRYFKSVSNGRVNPHMLRHTYATKLMENGTSLMVVRDLLGHEKSTTTEVYIHASEERKRIAVRTLQSESKVKILLKHYFPKWFRIKNIHVLPTSHGWTKYHIGRKSEIAELVSLAEKRVNVLIIGDQGVGKSHLLDNYESGKILRVDDTKEFRKVLAAMLLKVVENEGPQFERIPNADGDGWDEIEVKNAKEVLLEMLGSNRQIITTHSVKRLTELLIKLTEKHEYSIIIDSADDVTPSVIKTLELLRNHFHFIVAARKIKTEAATWLTNFQKIELKPLNRNETLELITRASEDFRERIENVETFKTRIFNQTNGNPQFTLELIDRFRKEQFVSADLLTSIEHTAGRKEFSMVPFIFLAFSTLIVLKYWSREAMPNDKEAFMLFGAIGMVLIMFGRFAISNLKRKYI